MEWNLPLIARKTMTDKKIDRSLAETNIPEKIEKAFGDPKLQKELSDEISKNLKRQIEKRAQIIKYAIENK